MEINKVFANVLACDEKEIEKNLDNENYINSLKKMECIFALEDEFGISFLPSDIEKIRSLRNLKDICSCKIE